MQPIPIPLTTNVQGSAGRLAQGLCELQEKCYAFCISCWLENQNPLTPMRQVPLERDINIAVNGCSGFATSTQKGPFTAMLISRSKGTYIIQPLLRKQLTPNYSHYTPNRCLG